MHNNNTGGKFLLISSVLVSSVTHKKNQWNMGMHDMFLDALLCVTQMWLETHTCTDFMHCNRMLVS